MQIDTTNAYKREAVFHEAIARPFPSEASADSASSCFRVSSPLCFAIAADCYCQQNGPFIFAVDKIRRHTLEP